MNLFCCEQLKWTGGYSSCVRAFRTATHMVPGTQKFWKQYILTNKFKIFYKNEITCFLSMCLEGHNNNNSEALAVVKQSRIITRFIGYYLLDFSLTPLYRYFSSGRIVAIYYG